jgi:hypothetical protein
MVNLPIELTEVMAPLFVSVPFEHSMPDLLPHSTAGIEALKLAEAIDPLLPSDELRAGLWLYVDELDRSHRVSQSIESHAGAYWHGIMHRREGDFSNAKYWFRRSGSMDLRIDGFDAIRFVDRVAAARGHDLSDLLELQRSEWSAMFSRCAELALEGRS